MEEDYEIINYGSLSLLWELFWFLQPRIVL